MQNSRTPFALPRGHSWILLSLFCIFSLTRVLCGAVVPKDIPPLNDWNNPAAKTLKGSLVNQSVYTALDTLANEMANRSQRLSENLNDLTPDFSNLPVLLELIIEDQIAIRSLLETFLYLNNLLPDEQKEGATPMFTKVRGTLTPLAGLFQSKQMIRAAEEIRMNLNNLNQPYWDVWAEIKKRTTEDASEPDSKESPQAPSEVQASPSTNPMSERLQTLRRSQPAQAAPQKLNFQKTWQALLNSEAEKHISDFLSFIQTEPRLLGDSLSAWDSQESVSDRPLDAPTRKCLAYALRKLLGQVSPQTAPQIAAAYALIATEDSLPEVMRFFMETIKQRQEGGKEENDTAPNTLKVPVSIDDMDDGGKTTTNQGMNMGDWVVWFHSFPFEKGYAADPRVHSIMKEYVLYGIAHTEKQPEILSTFERLRGNTSFILPMLEEPDKAAFALAVLSSVGNADSAVEVARMLKTGHLATNLRSDALLLLGKIGDERVAQTVLKQLVNPYLKEQAQEALILMGPKGEDVVLTALKAKRPEITLIVFDILREIGTRKSLGCLAGQIYAYAKAISPEEAKTAEDSGEKSPLILETVVRNEVIRKGIEAGTAIIARLTETDPVDFESQKQGTGPLSNKNRTNDLLQELRRMGLPPEMLQLITPTMLEDVLEKGYQGLPAIARQNIPPAQRQAVEMAIERVRREGMPQEFQQQVVTLSETQESIPIDPETAEEMFRWIVALSESAVILYTEIDQSLTGLTTPEAAKQAGEKMRAYDWAEEYYTQAFSQIEDICLPVLSPEQLKVCKNYAGRVQKAMTASESRVKRLLDNKQLADAFEEGLTGMVKETTKEPATAKAGSARTKKTQEPRESKSNTAKTTKPESIRFTPVKKN